ncbi:MAG TPA: type II toxin-antitoxin system Phd/YefM family antitoxin [Thermoanaerobaculia bacterium]|jgi:antitoxin YefM
MAIHTTYTQARANLAKLCDQVTDDREVVIIERRNGHPVAMVDAAELISLLETAHLLRSPKNAQRLLAALERARAGTVEPQSVENLRQELGLA